VRVAALPALSRVEEAEQLVPAMSARSAAPHLNAVDRGRAYLEAAARRQSQCRLAEV